MQLSIPVPHLTTAHAGPASHIEDLILTHSVKIESWFRTQWQLTKPSITSSVDLRNAGFKLAPVDTNLFPAGFNNLNSDFLPLCVQAIQAVLDDFIPTCRKVLILPESHTRNIYYAQSLNVLKEILVKAGYEVHIGSLEPTALMMPQEELNDSQRMSFEPIFRENDYLKTNDFNPCFILLNNDLSEGIPDLLLNLRQPIQPLPELGWASRLKSTHFRYYDEVAAEFTKLVDMDPWLINPSFTAIDQIDFMNYEGLDILEQETQKILENTAQKYAEYGINQTPFAVIKADNGTYGMSVMMVRDASELKSLNRKQRKKMAAIKGGQSVRRVLIQEGVYTFEAMQQGEAAEPVVYMLGQYVVGGFYRVHQGRGQDENLNAPGMHFEPLAFAQPCNMPCTSYQRTDSNINRFYVYGVIARLAALAAAREMAAVRQGQGGV